MESMIDKTADVPARLVDLATAIDAEHRQAHASFRAYVGHALEAGRLLMAAKAAVPPAAASTSGPAVDLASSFPLARARVEASTLSTLS